MPNYYFDVSKRGKDLLGTKDIPMLSDAQAVKESIYNILMTRPGTRLMMPNYGIYLERYVFEFVDDLTAMMLKADIELCLNQNEPRISNINIVVTPDEENNTFIIDLDYAINFSTTRQEMSIDFKKLR